MSRRLLSQQHRQLLSLLAQPLGKHDDINTYVLGSNGPQPRGFGDVCMLGEESHC